MNRNERRVALTEGNAMEHGTKCPACGAYTSFSDIIATGQCTHGLRGDCDAALRLELVCGR